MKRVFIYARVSQNQQEFERQIIELTSYAALNSFEIAGVYSEKISGAKIERPEWNKMLNEIPGNNIDLLLVWEFSRLGRNALSVQTQINTLHRLGVGVYIKTLNFTTDPTGKDLFSNFMLQIFSSISELELGNIQQRLSAGRENYKNKGGRLGRRTDTTKTIEETKHFNEIKTYLNKGYKKKDIVTLCGVAPNTVLKIKKYISEKN